LKKSRGKRTDGVEKVTLASPSRFSSEWGERVRERERERKRSGGGKAESRNDETLFVFPL